MSDMSLCVCVSLLFREQLQQRASSQSFVPTSREEEVRISENSFHGKNALPFTQSVLLSVCLFVLLLQCLLLHHSGRSNRVRIVVCRRCSLNNGSPVNIISRSIDRFEI